MRRVLTTPPSIEPVTLAETKLFCKVTTSDDDDLITALITAARQYVEAYLAAALITQTWTFYFDGEEDIFENRYVNLPINPIISITSVKTYSDANVASTFSGAYYRLSGGRVLLNDNYEWPSVYRTTDSLEVVLTAGYGALATNVPQAIRLAIKKVLLEWYEKREAVYDPTEIAQNSGIPFGVTAMLSPFRNYFV